MRQSRILRLAVALVLIAVTAMLAVPPVSHAVEVVVKSAHLYQNEGVLELYGEFGTTPMTVWLADRQLQVQSQTAGEIVATMPSDVESGTYWVFVTSSADNGHYDSIVIAVGYGQQGTQGPAGPAGPAGPTGATGPQGPAGAVGATGAVGPQGPAGPAGPAGPVGATGAVGPMGPQGPTGADGAQGPVGPAGPAGANGAMGAIGPQGPAGPAGPAGPVGATGPQGPAGPQGATGLTGAVGPQGPEGPMGPAGPQGETGAQGPQGSPGLSGYQVATVTVNVNLAGQVGGQNIVVNCPGTTRVLSGFISRMPAGVRQAFPPGVAWSGWVSGAGQYTFSLKNTNFSGYADAVEAGAVCANTN